MTVNQRIKEELYARGWSQYQLSIISGIEQSTISKWFRDVPTNPSPSSVKKVAKAFGMKVSQLMGEEFDNDVQRRELEENWNRLNKAEKDCVLHVIKTIVKHR